MKIKFLSELFKSKKYVPKKFVYPIFFLLIYIIVVLQNPDTSTKIKNFLAEKGITEAMTLHDGSKTGKRVSYQSFCNPDQGFVIYENEKMTFVTDEGENVLWTQGDIDCYNQKKVLGLQQAATPIPTAKATPKSSVFKRVVESDPVVNCKFQHLGDQKLKDSECKKSFECQIKSQWYIYTDKEKCDKDQDAAYDSSNYVPTTYNYQYNPTPPLSSYSQDPNSIVHDCEIDGKNVGQMTSPECREKINQYYQERMPTQTDNRNQRVNDCLAKFRALGTLSSSEAQKCYTIE
jgi:hypothetical protein